MKQNGVVPLTFPMTQPQQRDRMILEQYILREILAQRTDLLKQARQPCTLLIGASMLAALQDEGKRRWIEVPILPGAQLYGLTIVLDKIEAWRLEVQGETLQGTDAVL